MKKRRHEVSSEANLAEPDTGLEALGANPKLLARIVESDFSHSGPSHLKDRSGVALSRAGLLTNRLFSVRAI